MSITPNLGLTQLDSGMRQPEVVINANNLLLDGAVGSGAWASWTPTWTNLSVGNGTVVAKYQKIRNIVFCRLSLTFGSTTSISGDVTFSFPVTAASYAGGANQTILGHGSLLDSSPGVDYVGYVTWASTTTARIRTFNASGTYLTEVQISSTVPFTWAATDEIDIQFYFEAA